MKDRDSSSATGRYRWRTALRTRLPRWAVGLAPKGRKDCGDHDWYRSDPDTWRCYHCRAGVRLG